MVIRLVQNIRIRQKHQVVVPKLHDLDGLGEDKSTDVPDIVRSKVETWGAGRPALWRWRHHVGLVSSMVEMVSGLDRNYAGPAPPPTRGN